MKRLDQAGGTLLLASDEPVAKGWILEAMVNAMVLNGRPTDPQTGASRPRAGPAPVTWPRRNVKAAAPTGFCSGAIDGADRRLAL